MRKTGLGSTYMQKTCLTYKIDTQSGPDHLCFNPIGANLCLGILPPFRRHEWFKRITQTTVFDSFFQWYSFFTPKRELLLSLPLLLTKERVSDSLQSDGSYLLFCMSKSLFSPLKKTSDSLPSIWTKERREWFALFHEQIIIWILFYLYCVYKKSNLKGVKKSKFHSIIILFLGYF